MEPAAKIPPPATVELDALRLLTLVHQLGEGLAQENGSLLRGERQLQALDHLIRHPETLALLLVDAYERLPELAEKRASLLRRLRWLLNAENAPPAPTFRRARSRVQGSERRLTLFGTTIPCGGGTTPSPTSPAAPCWRSSCWMASRPWSPTG